MEKEVVLEALLQDHQARILLLQRHYLQRLRHSINKAQEALSDVEEALDSLSPNLNKRIQQIFSGNLHQAESNALQEREVEKLLQAVKHRNKPRSRRLLRDQLH